MGVSLAGHLRRSTASAGPERVLFEVTGRGGKDGAPIAKYPGTGRKARRIAGCMTTPRPCSSICVTIRAEKNNIAGQQPAIAALSGAYDEWFGQAVAATAGEVQRFPITLAEGTELLAPSATLEGGAKFFGQGWDNDWAFFPTNTAAVVWNVNVPRAGRYEVTVQHTAKAPGGKIQVTVGENLVETDASPRPTTHLRSRAMTS